MFGNDSVIFNVSATSPPSKLHLGTCDTSYSGRFVLEKEHFISLIAIDLLVMILNLVFNLLVILSLIWSRQLHNSSLKLIMCLSISDCCLACIVQPLFASLLIKYPDVSNCDFEVILQFAAIFFTHTSGYIIALIGFDRYARVKYMTNYSSIVTTSRIKKLVLVMIILSLIQATLYVLGTKLEFFDKAKKVAVIIDFIIALTVLVVYLMAVRAVKTHRKCSEHKELLKKIDNTVTSIASKILLSIVIFYILYVIIAMTHSVFHMKVKGNSRKWLEFMLLIGYVLTYTNSFVNAAIFLSVNKKARRALKDRFGSDDYDATVSSLDVILTEIEVRGE